MYPHQEETLRNTIAYLQKDPDAEAVLLGGSIAHGFETAASDVDVMVLIPERLYEEKKQQGRLTFFNKELATYPEGYVDGKYIALSYLEQVAEKGSEPARFAFQGARVMWSKRDGLEDVLQRAARYPVEGKAERLMRFAAQLEAWHWYVNEALRQGNRYLMWMAVGRLVLFGGRLILAHNEMLYPYHKWFMRVLASAPDRPPELMESIEALYADPSAQTARRFYELVKGFQDWGMTEARWGAQFLIDSEQNWLTGWTPIDDL